MQANKFKSKCSKIFYVSKVRRSELEYVYAGCLVMAGLLQDVWCLRYFLNCQTSSQLLQGNINIRNIKNFVFILHV